MNNKKFSFLAVLLLMISALAFAQPGGDMGGGFPPMGGGMGQMGQTNGQMGQQNSSRKKITEGVDLSTLSVINDEQQLKLVEQLKKKIEKHNKVILSKFDADKDGQLNKKELKAWKNWLSEEMEQPSMPDFMSNEMTGNEMTAQHTSQNAQHPMNGMPPSGGMGQANPTITATAVNAINSIITISAKTLSSNQSNESVIRIKKGGKLNAEDITLKKTAGDTSSGDESNFYGLNAALAAEAGATATVNGGSIMTNAEGANAVFAYGKDAKFNIDNLNIETQKNSSRGLDATFGGTIIAKNVTIHTKGAHCAALATDRGEGTVTVGNCNATTEGEGSPGIYSTGAISATNSIFHASGSEAAVIEGKNSIILDGCTLTGLKSCGVMLYQSFSGDANVGTSVLNMKNSKLTAGAGPMFYCTNTQTKITLENDELIGHTGVLLNAASNQRWGMQGKNGAQVTLSTTNQTLEGSIFVDAISSANIAFGSGTLFTGTINPDNQSKQVNLTLSKGSKWILTSDSNIQNLVAQGQSVDEALKSIQLNGHKLNYTKTVAENK